MGSPSPVEAEDSDPGHASDNVSFGDPVEAAAAATAVGGDDEELLLLLARILNNNPDDSSEESYLKSKVAQTKLDEALVQKLAKVAMPSIDLEATTHAWFKPGGKTCFDEEDAFHFMLCSSKSDWVEQVYGSPWKHPPRVPVPRYHLVALEKPEDVYLSVPALTGNRTQPGNAQPVGPLVDFGPVSIRQKLSNRYAIASLGRSGKSYLESVQRIGHLLAASVSAAPADGQINNFCVVAPEMVELDPAHPEYEAASSALYLRAVWVGTNDQLNMLYLYDVWTLTRLRKQHERDSVLPMPPRMASSGPPPLVSFVILDDNEQQPSNLEPRGPELSMLCAEAILRFVRDGSSLSRLLRHSEIPLEVWLKILGGWNGGYGVVDRTPDAVLEVSAKAVRDQVENVAFRRQCTIGQASALCCMLSRVLRVRPRLRDAVAALAQTVDLELQGLARILDRLRILDLADYLWKANQVSSDGDASISSAILLSFIDRIRKWTEVVTKPFHSTAAAPQAAPYVNWKDAVLMTKSQLDFVAFKVRGLDTYRCGSGGFKSVKSSSKAAGANRHEQLKSEDEIRSQALSGLTYMCSLSSSFLQAHNVVAIPPNNHGTVTADICGLLNRKEGGIVFFGALMNPPDVQNSSGYHSCRMAGMILSRSDRDCFRQGIDSLLKKISPDPFFDDRVEEPVFHRLDHHPHSFKDREGVVVQLNIKPTPDGHLDIVYRARGDPDQGYVRIDGRTVTRTAENLSYLESCETKIVA